jgi:uncharacterized damage-inducible protein DinB
MKRCLTTTLIAAFACFWPAQAQNNPLIGENKAAYNTIKNNLMGMAEAAPDADYNYKPTPDVRSFGELMGHIADVQMRFCAMALGEQKAANAGTKTRKADLVAALKASFDECDALANSITDANATQMVGSGKMARSKLGVLAFVVTHDNEEYGYGSVYLRLKNIVPPSTAQGMR